jgi:hypothetical protein
LKEAVEYFKFYKYGGTFLMQSMVNMPAYPEIVVSQVITEWVRQCINLSLPYSQLCQIMLLRKKPLDSKSVSVTLSNDYDLVRVGTELRLKPRNIISDSLFNCSAQSYLLSESFSKVLILGDCKYFKVHNETVTHPLHEEEFNIDLPYSENSRSVYQLRYSRDGDVFNMASLVEYFRKLKIPVYERDRIPVLALLSQRSLQDDIITVGSHNASRQVVAVMKPSSSNSSSKAIYSSSHANMLKTKNSVIITIKLLQKLENQYLNLSK